GRGAVVAENGLLQKADQRKPKKAKIRRGNSPREQAIRATNSGQAGARLQTNQRMISKASGGTVQRTVHSSDKSRVGAVPRIHESLHFGAAQVRSHGF